MKILTSIRHRLGPLGWAGCFLFVFSLSAMVAVGIDQILFPYREPYMTVFDCVMFVGIFLMIISIPLFVAVFIGACLSRFTEKYPRWTSTALSAVAFGTLITALYWITETIQTHKPQGTNSFQAFLILMGIGFCCGILRGKSTK